MSMLRVVIIFAVCTQATGNIMTIHNSATTRAWHEITTALIATGSGPRVKLVFALLGTVLLAGAGVGLPAPSAGASVTRSVSAARTKATPETNYVTLNFKNGTSHGYPCDGGSTFHTDMPNYIKSASNNCHVRVWLHTHNDNSGYSACMSPQHSYTADDTVKYVNVYVSTNPDDCQY